MPRPLEMLGVAAIAIGLAAVPSVAAAAPTYNGPVESFEGSLTLRVAAGYSSTCSGMDRAWATSSVATTRANHAGTGESVQVVGTMSTEQGIAGSNLKSVDFTADLDADGRLNAVTVLTPAAPTVRQNIANFIAISEDFLFSGSVVQQGLPIPIDVRATRERLMSLLESQDPSARSFNLSLTSIPTGATLRGGERYLVVETKMRMSWFSRGSSFVHTSEGYDLVHLDSGQIGEYHFEQKQTRDSQSVTWETSTSCSISASVRLAKIPEATTQEAGPDHTLASTGSGFVVDEKGHVLTNYHVIDDCSEVRLRLGLLGSQASAVVATDSQNDLALIRSDLETESIALFREGRSIRPGDSVVALGFPLRGLLSSQPSVTTGTVSALAGIRDDIRFLQITAPVQPGNSGGPLLDSSGNIVGIVVGKLDAVKVAELLGDIPQNVNFAIKGSVARSFLDANAVDYETDQSTTKLGAADIADRAREFTVLVECWN